LFQSTRALGDDDASCSAYIVSTPVTSTSQALGRKFSLIMLIEVQTLQPWLACKEVQHWMAVASR
jgi:hypothetical protein